ncbi:ent-copalyl diphosphate synthase 1, chloroplastic isoform X3 [Oryza glaberrima]|uniref:ent-copalyl diphosphate synthase 1, chloroplastic isoform X3 n=1 Tax=Oryza glaberrima TaxID=4538 RepID=UPI00224BE947|nr:ent-copalyl diphosphate synthase 1, chloroplastic isoform X3 [Oryza glaberrima]
MIHLHSPPTAPAAFGGAGSADWRRRRRWSWSSSSRAPVAIGGGHLRPCVWRRGGDDGGGEDHHADGGGGGGGGAAWRARATTAGVSSSSSTAKGLQANIIEHETPRITKWPNESRDLDDHQQNNEADEEADDELQPLVEQVRSMLSSMEDGVITASAYDTAWVALVPRLDGEGGAQFPAAVRWIVGSQLADGSWGDEALFSAYDRVINTLACVVALTRWSLHHDQCKQGLQFLNLNLWRLVEEEPDTMPIGFEIAFPSLVEAARGLGIDFPYDHPALKGIYANRELKLKRIPKDMMHIVPTSILHSLEGMPGLDWQRLLKLQCSDGSFLFSPSATAYALMQTGDKKCFAYIDRIIKKFDGGVPNVYPVDLFEHIWVVDRLERLGISRYFQREIEQNMDYVNRHWTEDGICWARNSNVKEVDDTAMAFRLLRLHGYNVSPSVFKNFEKDGEFFCFVGQSTQAVTGMYNLNRASQISFPGEDILQRARNFSYEFLREREAQGTLHDKWIISKDLPGEVQYTLDFPWYASLPRVEARTYIGQYGGNDDVWIGKTLYRMPIVNNATYLELAKQDFNRCQALHQHELQGLQNDMSSMKRMERFMWSSLYEENGNVLGLEGYAKDGILARTLCQLIDLLSQETPPVREGQKCIHNLIRCAWIEWMMQQINMKDGRYGKGRVMYPGSCTVHNKETCLLIAQIVEICAGRIEEAASMINNTEGSWFIQLASSICDSLHAKMLLSQDTKKNETTINQIDKEIELDMQELAQYLLPRVDDRRINNKTKQTFLSIVKSCYYAANCSPHMLDQHISEVIFEQVI